MPTWRATALLAALLLAPHSGWGQAPARPGAPAPAAPAAPGGEERPAMAEKPVVLRVEQAVVLRGPGER